VWSREDQAAVRAVADSGLIAFETDLDRRLTACGADDDLRAATAAALFVAAMRVHELVERWIAAAGCVH